MTRTKSSVLISASILAALGACSSRPHGMAAATPAPVAAAPAPTRPDGALSLGERLAREAASRPAGGLRVEAVAQTLAAGGLALGPLHQVLARTVGARYCASARSAAGSAVALCEFADDATAARGLDYSRATFDRLVPGRRLARARNLTVTLTPAQPGAGFADDASRAGAVLAAL